jgi:hypothetical protein
MEKEDKPFKNIYDELIEHKFFGVLVSKAVTISSEKIKCKVFEIIKYLNSSKINLYSLNKIIFEGLPDDIPSLRSLIWKILLGIIPLDSNQWESVLDKKRNDYKKLRKQYLEKLELDKIRESEDKNKIKHGGGVNTQHDTNIENNIIDKPKVKKKKNIIDHPLAISDDSKWKHYFDDLEFYEEIDKDVRRTRTHMHFFFMPAKTLSNSITFISNEDITTLADRKRNEPSSTNTHKSFETNADVMCRILFIYGKKYPNVRYVQGMNEILAPIYYCFSLDQNPYFNEDLEVDSFLCFESIMNEISDIFIRSKDNTKTGIQTRIAGLREMLKITDRGLYDHFIEQKLEIQFFVFRWITLFFTQEFEMPDVLRLWDSILSENDKFEFLNYLCLSILRIKRTEILNSDFAEMMLNLQNLEKIDVENFIKNAVDIKLDFNLRLD